MLMLLSLPGVPALAVDIKGAGSSAALPLYENWAKAYMDTSRDFVTYEGAGSTAGLKKVKEHAVDFGASDIAIAPTDSDSKVLVCVPTSITGVVPFVNLPGFRPGQLNLSGSVLADIYAGKIKVWNDSAIAALNPGKSLPALPIYTVARIEGSGTTYVFTDFLSKTSPEWHDNFGTNLIVPWADSVHKVKGSTGVIAEVKKNSGAIGYVDYGYSLQEHLTYVSLLNRDKKMVEPTFAGFNSALTNSDWKTKANFEEILTDRPGPETWPITTATFILIPRVTLTPEKTIAVMKFISWGFLHGDEIARKVGYVRLIDPLQAKVFSILLTVTDKNGQTLKWTPF